jgi:histidinol-phosphatase (PHP family)
MDEYLERATQLGIREFGFAEHSWWMLKPEPKKLCPTYEEFLLYIQMVEERKKLYNGTSGRPLLRLGIEADWVPERLTEAREFIDAHPFDYVYGSVHHLPDPLDEKLITVWHFKSPDWEQMLQRYFHAMQELVNSRLCDVLAHLDVLKRSCKIPAEAFIPHVQELIPHLKKNGTAVEINASGKDHPNHTFFPTQDILNILVGEGIPITFGSDGHALHQVGRHAAEVLESFKRAGGTHYARFQKREMILTPA